MAFTYHGKGRLNERPKVKPDNPAQFKRFIEAAKALGVDEDGETFNRVLGEMLKAQAEGKKGWKQLDLFEN